MINKHVTELDIQHYVLRKTDCDSKIIEHIHQCQQCRAEVAVYALLFAEIEQVPNPAFDFDIANLVMQQLPEKQHLSLDRSFLALLSGISIAFLSIFIYMVYRYFPTLFHGISSIQFSLILSTAILISVFIYMDMKQRYADKMSLL